MRIYTAVFENVTIAAAQDLVAIRGSADRVIQLRKVWIFLVGTTLATAQGIRCRVKDSGGTLTLGSGGGSYTSIPLDPTDTAFGGTAHINDTTPATTGGSFRNITPAGGHIYGGFKFDWGHEGPLRGGTGGFVFDTPSTVSGTCIFSGGVEFAEMG